MRPPPSLLAIPPFSLRREPSPNYFQQALSPLIGRFLMASSVAFSFLKVEGANDYTDVLKKQACLK